MVKQTISPTLFYSLKEEGWQDCGSCQEQNAFIHQDHQTVFQHRWVRLRPGQSWSFDTAQAAHLWVIIAGQAHLTAPHNAQTLKAGDSVFCPAATALTLHNDSNQDLVYLELRYAPLSRWRLLKALLLPPSRVHAVDGLAPQSIDDASPRLVAQGTDSIQKRPLQPDAWNQTPYGNIAQEPFSRQALHAEFSVKWLKLKPGMGNDLHNQPLTETYVFFQGEGHVRVNAEQFTCRPGDGVLIPSLAQHWLRNDASEDVILLSIKYAPVTLEAIATTLRTKLQSLFK